MKKVIVVLVLVVLAVFLSGCSQEADKVNHNLSIAADNFGVMRRITVYNARTDTIILELEGLMSISNSSTKELVVTCKVGEDAYKKNYVYLNDYTLYVVEDISGTDTDPYHYQVRFHTSVLPSVTFER